MRRLLACSLLIQVALPGQALAAEDAIQLETTRIISNEELPGILYLVPWKDVEASHSDRQKLLLHDFFGNLYDPVLPDQPSDPGT